jgi:DNA invertase Pin-like site-specific DNA recombinase
MHHAYARVSTTGQDAESQILGIREYCASHAIHLDLITTDMASGAVPWHQRKIRPLLEEARSGDTIIVSELSRVGRSTVDVLDFLREAASRAVSVYVVKSAMLVDASIQSKIITTVMALAAEIERDFTRARALEGMARARAEGVHMGRPPGSLGASKCADHQAEILRLLNRDVPIATIARVIGVHRHTLARYIARQSTIA